MSENRLDDAKMLLTGGWESPAMRRTLRQRLQNEVLRGHTESAFGKTPIQYLGEGRARACTRATVSYRGQPWRVELLLGKQPESHWQVQTWAVRKIEASERKDPMLAQCKGLLD